VAALPLASPAAPAGQQTAGWRPLDPVSVTFADGGGAAVGTEQAGTTATGPRMRLLGFNDFHGAIEPPSGGAFTINGTPVGGVEYLAKTVNKLRTKYRYAGERVVTVAAGDLIGASPLISAAFHDEPAIETLSRGVGLDISSVGNHEFDEGVAELKRLQNGGCHPVDGCQDGDGFAGAGFRYLSANVVHRRSRLPALPAYTVRDVGGVKVGFIGLTLRGTPSIVNPTGIRTVDFLDEADTANYWAAKLRREQGIQSFVLLVHQGGFQQTSVGTLPDPNSCQDFAGDIVPIVKELQPEFRVVVSGHTHRYYTCALPNARGTSVVTSAGSNGTLVTDIGVRVSTTSKRIVAVDAQNRLVQNSKLVNGTYVLDPAKADLRTKQIADKYRRAVAPIANRVVGRISADISNTPNAAGESLLGDVIADAQLAYTSSASTGNADVALMNPGGIRAPLVAGQISGGEQPGQVTYGEAFTVQPFNNLVVTQTFTGAALKNVLEQQFVGYAGQTTQRILQPSRGLTYTWSQSASPGEKVRNLRLNGAPVDPNASYRVTTNDFLANGGDAFTLLTGGTSRTVAPGFDIDALTSYLQANSPVAPGPANRIRVVS